jgi:hypothetical protein
MAITRIDSARPASIQNQEQAQSVENQERVKLFETEAFEKAPIINLQNGTSLRMPMGTGSEEAKALTTRLDGLSADQTNTLMGSVDTLVKAVKQEAIESSDLSSCSQNLQSISNNTITSSLSTLGLKPNEQGEAVGTVMALGMGSINGDLENYALRVQDKNNAASEMRDTLRDLRDVISEDKWPQDFDYTEVTFDKDGNMTMTEKTVTLGSKEEAQNLMADMDGTMNSLREFTEMDTFDLQNMYQEQQKFMNIFSAILENIHKTQQAMINNLKA